MRNIIIPSIIAKTQKELNMKLSKIKNYTTNIHLDIMDKMFVKNSSLDFNFVLPKTKHRYEAHLMMKNPEGWIEKNSKKVNSIIFHIEATKDPNRLIKLIKRKGRRVGIGIKPGTHINKIKPFLKDLDQIIVMTVNPGRYGAKFQKSVLKKIEQLRKLKPKINIEADGGINDKTIKDVSESGVNMFVVGSFIQKSKNIKKDINILKKLTKGGNK